MPFLIAFAFIRTYFRPKNKDRTFNEILHAFYAAPERLECNVNVSKPEHVQYRVVVLGTTNSTYFEMIKTDWFEMLYMVNISAKSGDKYDGDSDGENNYSYDCKYIYRQNCLLMWW